jgi:thymidylate synthase (FAD)
MKLTNGPKTPDIQTAFNEGWDQGRKDALRAVEWDRKFEIAANLEGLEFRQDVDVWLEQTNATDLSVARAAWVSTKGVDAREAEGRIDGLINYLTRERHGSPFEHNQFTFFVECPIFVTREFFRHRIGWSYNEWSGRYDVMRPIFYVPRRERKLVQIGKNGSYTFEPGSDEQYAITKEAVMANSAEAWARYQGMLKAGVAKEVARDVLPLNIYTSFYATCNARSLMSFLSLRTENLSATFVSHPLDEIQLVADQMEALFAEQMPITHEAWNRNGRVAP